MNTASKFLDSLSQLILQGKKFWLQVYPQLKKISNTILTQAIFTAKNLQLIYVFFLKQANRFIDYVAHHYLLDKSEKLYLDLKNHIHQWTLFLQQTSTYKKLGLYAQLIRLDKPIGILLLLWPTLIALWIAAEGWPDPLVLFVFVAGVILMRSAGCAINDYADREIDKKVARTKQRPLTSGKITEKETLMVFASLSLIAFILVLFMNELTIWI